LESGSTKAHGGIFGELSFSETGQIDNLPPFDVDLSYRITSRVQMFSEIDSSSAEGSNPKPKSYHINYPINLIPQ
jgi:hypothetical protein